MSAGSHLLLDRVRAATSDEYTIERELGRGGMAAVFLARDIALDRQVAIKVMLPELADVPGFQDRFVIEARTAAHLDHPGIVAVFAVKQRAGLTFIVMKLIVGCPLDQVLGTRGALDPSVAATIGSRIADALHFAHRNGVVHRDVKPSNIIIDAHGRPIVTDFGIAKVTASPALTIAGATLGTPTYMSPEQCRGLPATAASDQYALGVMLFELLTGRAPFYGSLFELLTAHATLPPPSLRGSVPSIDPALEAAVMQMLAKNPDERFPSLGDAAKVLAARTPRRSQAAEMQAIIEGIAPPPGEAPPALVIDPTTAATEEMAAALPPLFPGTVVVESPRAPVELPLTVAVGDQPSGTGKRALLGLAAVVVLAAIGYAIVANRTTHDAPAPTAQPIQASKTDTAAVVAKLDTNAPAKLDTSAPPVASATPKPPPPKIERPKPSAKRTAAAITPGTDSIAARCAELKLKFSVGEELARADTTFLRRECAKQRP